MAATPKGTGSCFLWMAVAYAGCTLTSSEGQFACIDNRQCPEAWTCREGRCYSGSQDGGSTTGDGDTGSAPTGTATDTTHGSEPPVSDSGTDGESTSGSTETWASDSASEPSATSTEAGSTETLTAASTATPTESPASDTGPTDSDTTGFDGGEVPDASSTDGVCECTSGPCCASNCLFYTAQERRICGQTTIVKCANAACGAAIRSRPADILCSGSSSACGEGSIVQTGSWVTVITCSPNEKCIEEEGQDPACVEDASCLK